MKTDTPDMTPAPLPTLVMIPTYNEAENVEVIVNGITATGLDVDLLFVDDNSPDGTGAILDRLAAAQPRLHVLHRTAKQGIGSAHKAGIAWAYEHGYTRLVTMDSDLSHSPSNVGRLLETLAGSDLAVASRFINRDSLQGWTWGRKLLTYLGHTMTTLVLNLPQDSTNAFRVYRLDRIPAALFASVESNGYSFFYESLHRLNVNGFRIAQLAIALPARTYGHSKMRFSDMWHSVTFLGRLGRRTWTNRRSLMHVPPFAGVETGDRIQAEWDDYWSGTTYRGQRIYDAVASIYRRFIIRPAVNHFLKTTFTPGARLLHAGCGTGTVDLGVYRRFNITAFDISPKALAQYARHHGAAATLLQGTIFDIPADAGTFDGIFNLGVMEHFTEEQIHQILDEFHRVLKPGGNIVLFWPPAVGPSVVVLDCIHYLLKLMGKKDVVLHPAEVTRAASREQVARYLAAAGFTLDTYYCGVRDMFTHRIICGRRDDVAAPAPMAKPVLQQQSYT